MVSLTSMLSSAAAEPEPLALEQWSLVVESTVHESSVPPVVLSMTATRTVSEPLIDALESAYRFVTAPPLAGIGARRVLLEKPVVLAAHAPVPAGPMAV